jgi:hypothetical protein
MFPLSKWSGAALGGSGPVTVVERVAREPRVALDRLDADDKARECFPDTLQNGSVPTGNVAECTT